VGRGRANRGDGGNEATGMRESGRNGRHRVLATRFWKDHVLKLRLPFDGSVASAGTMRLDRLRPGSSWNLLFLPLRSASTSPLSERQGGLRDNMRKQTASIRGGPSLADDDDDGLISVSISISIRGNETRTYEHTSRTNFTPRIDRPEGLRLSAYDFFIVIHFDSH
jgi:hypothetical protein